MVNWNISFQLAIYLYFMNTAIIVAAGSGARFGADIPKQFIEILGKPLLIHTLLRFENCNAIDQIILVLSESAIDGFAEIVSKFQVMKISKIVSGGETRAESVFNGLNALTGGETEIVAVHDGARPLVSCQEITETIRLATETGAACLVGKVNDTIKDVSSGKISATVNRDNLRRALTPQCFRVEILKRAFENADLTSAATDECFLVEKFGVEIAFIDGSARNIKVTTQDDLKIAELFLKENYV